MNAFYFQSMNICIWLSCVSAVFIWNLCNAELKTEPVFECDFEKSTCGLTNDVDHEARWERRYMSLGGRSSTMMITKIGGKKKQIARLLSPILDGHWSAKEGCLSLDLYAAGDGITAFRVKKQDDSGVFPLIGVHTVVTKWRKYNLHVDIDDYIRFILEAHVNPELGGTLVAIDNISFKLEDCKD